MKTKICGITSYEDAMIAIEAGADALGFVFYPKSPRALSITQAKDIISKLPPFVEKVALFVNVEADEVNKTTLAVGATLAQLHFEVSDSFCHALKVPYIKVLRAASQENILKRDKESYLLVDAYCEAYGGAGKRINIEWFKDVDCSKIILAGGLDPLNVASLKSYGFYGVDVSSGVEISHGKKDASKVKAFIQNAQ